jgi:hypothetical protein
LRKAEKEVEEAKNRRASALTYPQLGGHGNVQGEVLMKETVVENRWMEIHRLQQKVLDLVGPSKEVGLDGDGCA